MTGSGRSEASGITERQRQVLEHIKTTVAGRGYPPSVREICEAVGLSSPSTVHSHLASLAKAGLIRRDPTKPRAIEILDTDQVTAPTPADLGEHIREVPLLGRIAAGAPILATDDIEDIMPLPTELVGNDPVFMLRVRGDSMINAGILDGDLVVVRRQDDANDGDIIVALIDEEEATVKRIRRRDGKVILEAENPAYEPMVFERDVRIVGKVVSVLRKVG